MIRPKPLAFALVLAFLLLAAPASAWGPRGHRLVAELAAAALTPSARAQVDLLLQGEPEPTLAGVANWADELRANDPDLGRRSAKWHYVNIGESGCEYVAARDCPDGDCVVEAIRTQATILADRSQPLPARRQALKFVVHFVGDVHQPMHAGHARDKGGNTVQLSIPDGSRDGRGSNLHALWDSGLFRDLGESEARHAARLRALPGIVAGSADPADWARESCRIVLRPGVYPPRARLDPRYIDTWRPVAERQVALGGRRLAALLNDALGD
ncbi:S1/P1 nuclease [Luteimonas sp. R10]|uniref:S1/P1 nuclease n=1 Tax=Luteimonas sp. R10 TaxID=3108176 RepID=UPI0030902EE2|nr:S1/P1 nuclease [Luteimonas sp. R10]